MPLTEYDDQLAFALEKIRTLEYVVMGLVMADRNPPNLRKNVEMLITSSDTNDLYQTMSDFDLDVVKRARAETFEVVFRGVKGPAPSSPE